MVRCSRSASNTWVSCARTFLLSQLKHRTSLFMAALRVGSAHSNAASGAPEYRRSFHFRSKTVRRIERTDTIDKGNSAPRLTPSCPVPAACKCDRPHFIHSEELNIFNKPALLHSKLESYNYILNIQ